MMLTMILMRGLPGSGKSTLAKKLAKEFNAVIVSADDWFRSEDGQYIWDPSELRNAHKACKIRVDDLLSAGVNVIVDNTNISEWEMAPYWGIAQLYAAHTETREPETPWRYDPEECAKRTIHGVPVEKIKMMQARWGQ